MKTFGLPGASAGLLGFATAEGLKLTAVPAGALPTETGVRVLRFVRQMLKDDAEFVVGRRVNMIHMVTDRRPPSVNEAKALRYWWPRGALPDGGLPWSVVLARTAGDPDAILLAGYMEDAYDFGYDSMHCEWGYVINLENRVLEVYRGLTVDPPTAGWWSGSEWPEGKECREQRRQETGRDWYPINRVAKFSFDQLPSDEAFLTHLAHLF